MKYRLDQLLVDRQLAPDLPKAQAFILAGLVEVNCQRADKAGTMFPLECQIEVKGKNCRYVSRGGLKLEKGLNFFSINPTALICADVGASTGGFTDCLLQKGANLVYAIDVGYGQLDWSLRQNQKVVVMERVNARHLQPTDLKDKLDLAVIDAAFISLKLLIPPLLALFKDKIEILALIKPQFEVKKGEVGKRGVVKDPELHQQVIADICNFSDSLGLFSVGVTPSPILGPKGNKEFLIHLKSQQ
jgi:23S rRNA (cytidine1920-2'-O)/16S rRNA (cytidine1409-2'-O)-methyltransferase